MRCALMSRLLVGWAMVACACDSGDVGLGGPDTLVRVDQEPAGANCDGGGIAVHTGLDDDGDFYLDDDEIDSTQYVCSGIALVECQGGNVLRKTVAVSAAEDWDQLAGVHCVDGDLLLVGLDADAVPDLADLAIVTGDVVVAANPNLATLEGIGGLREVGGTYLIQGNASLLNLAGLGSIERARSIGVVGNGRLRDLTGIADLTGFGGAIDVSHNPALTELTGLDSLEHLHGQLTIHSNRQLTSLSALGSLREITLLEIDANAALPAVELPALELVEGRLLVRDNAALARIDLPVLLSIGDAASFGSNPSLTEVRAPLLVGTGSLTLSGAAALRRLDMPSLLHVTGRLELRILSQLAAIDLPALLSVGTNVVIEGTAAVGFAGLGIETIGGNFTVRDNLALLDFTGLDQLEFVAGDLAVSANDSLTSFDGLGGLHEVGGALSITNNLSLPTARAQALADRLVIGGTVTITGNQ